MKEIPTQKIGIGSYNGKNSFFSAPTRRKEEKMACKRLQKKSVLTAEDWFTLFKWTLGSEKLCMTDTEFSMWHFLVSRTIGQKRFSVKMKNKNFKRLYQDRTTCGLPTWGAREIQVVLRSLKDKGFIWFNYEHDGRFNYIINLPVLVNKWKVKNVCRREILAAVLDKAIGKFMCDGYGSLCEEAFTLREVSHA